MAGKYNNFLLLILYVVIIVELTGAIDSVALRQTLVQFSGRVILRRIELLNISLDNSHCTHGRWMSH